MNWLNYWRLYCRTFNIKICRKCGERLDKDFKKRKQGYLCYKCYCKSQQVGYAIIRIGEYTQSALPLSSYALFKPSHFATRCTIFSNVYLRGNHCLFQIRFSVVKPLYLFILIVNLLVCLVSPRQTGIKRIFLMPMVLQVGFTPQSFVQLWVALKLNGLYLMSLIRINLNRYLSITFLYFYIKSILSRPPISLSLQIRFTMS